MRRGRARVGCSGWQYRHWRDSFYPSEITLSRWFEHYSTIFDTVEINNSFYRLPEPSTFARWAERAPSNFLFAVKASRYLTHMKKLKDPEPALERFFERASHLGKHLGPVLYQLPPAWKLDLPRLEHFLQVLPRNARHAIEFRDASWYADEVLDLMRDRDVALCLHDMRGSATDRRRVASFVYVRFHGPSGQYGGGYTRERLRVWASWLETQLEDGADVYAYFNNDIGGHAPRDAVSLRRLLESQAC
jgi:uncharacterized protein YecE (DUF72 family)